MTEKLEKNFTSVDELLGYFSNLEKILMTAKPLEFSIANIIKRVTSIIREQAKALDLAIDEAKMKKEEQESKNI